MTAVDRAGLRADITLAWRRPERDVRVAADDLESLLDALDAAERQRDDMTEHRAAAIEKIPALRAKVKAGAALRPEIGAVDDEDAMALLIMAAADVHGLWEREKERTKTLREALELVRNRIGTSIGWGIRGRDMLALELDAAIGTALAATDPAAGR